MNLLHAKLWLIFGSLALANTLHADELTDVRQLHSAGQTPAALQRAEQFLALQPKDPQMRFLKAVMLADTQQYAAAQTLLISLTEDYPDLAEPHNNLAALYAHAGQYDKARASLEQALRNNPAYATAHENLGDVHAALAAQSYARALQVDRMNTSAAPKLASTRELLKPRTAAAVK